MPILKSKRRLYPIYWQELSLYIRFRRAGGRCECMGECGLHRTHPGPRRCIEHDGEFAVWAKGKVMLTVAHLCHDPSCDDPEHLRAMCQRCHLRYDAKFHAQNASRTRRDRKAIADLFEGNPI